MRKADSMLRGVQPLNNHEWGHWTVARREVDDAGSRERLIVRKLGRRQLLVTPVLGNTVLSSSLYRQPTCLWYMCVHASKTPICIK